MGYAQMKRDKDVTLSYDMADGLKIYLVQKAGRILYEGSDFRIAQKEYEQANTNAFSNGQARARQVIANKMQNAGIGVENGRNVTLRSVEQTGQKRPVNVTGPGWYLMGESSQILRGGPWSSESQAQAEANKRKRGWGDGPLPVEFTQAQISKFKNAGVYQNMGSCSHFRRDTETCSTGCQQIGVGKGAACPTDGEERAGDIVCPCYA
jgi:hypothetical protein